MRIDMIIWSKDRAMQLDLLLRSTYQYAPFFDRIWVIWLATSDKFRAGYEQLIETHNIGEIEWVEQLASFKSHIGGVLTASGAGYILGNSDDNVFVDYVDKRRLKMDLLDCAISLRLHPGVNYCMPAKLSMKEPEFEITAEDELLRWNWTKCDPRGCWGYPHPCDSNIYRYEHLYGLLNSGEFSNPCSMEIWMNLNRNKNLPFMRCFERAKLVSISANTLHQEELDNPAGGATVAELNDLWLRGEVISLDDIAGINPPQCHIAGAYTYENQAV